MYKDTRRWARSYVGCQNYELIRHNKRSLVFFSPHEFRFNSVHSDLIGTLPNSNGYCHPLKCVDRITQWPEVVPVKDNTADAVAHTVEQ